jgi:hypothetical protein
VLGNTGYSLAMMGRNGEALQYQEEALAIRRKRQGEMGGSWSYFDMSIVYNNMGEFVKERECLEKAEAIFSKTGDKFGFAQTRLGLGNLMIQSGEIAGAKKCFNDALEVASSADMAGLVLAAKRSLIEAGWPSEKGNLDDLIKETEELGDKGLMMSMAETGAKLAMKRGEPARAIECARRGLEIWKGMKSRDLDGQGASLLLTRAKAARAGGDYEVALADASESSRIAGGCGRTWLVAQAEEFACSLKKSS